MTRCPHCNGDTGEYAALTRGRWWLNPTAIFYDGEQQKLTRAQARVLYLIARANGEPITHSDIPGMGEGTLAHHLRSIRKLLGDRTPVRLARGRGFAWETTP